MPKKDGRNSPNKARNPAVNPHAGTDLLDVPAVLLNPGHSSPASLCFSKTLIAFFSSLICWLASDIASSQGVEVLEYFDNFSIDLMFDMSIIILVADKYQKYRDAIEQAFLEMSELTTRKKAIESDISKLLQLAAANIAMLPASERTAIAKKLESLKEPSGLSEAIFRVLKHDKPMSAADVRDALIQSGYDLSNQVNALASIHTTLKRLADANKIFYANSAEKTLYLRPAVLSELKNK